MSILQRMIRRKVHEVVETVLSERLPELVFGAMVDAFKRRPDSTLTKAGFEWAFILALNELWPKTPADLCRRWLWDYLDAPYGTDGYDWTASAARSLAVEYVADCGEVAG